MKFITDLLRYFVSITTGIVLIFIAVLFVSGIDGISLKILCEIPLMGLITAIVTAIIHHNESYGKQFIIKILLHYLIIVLIMSIFGILFGWVSANISGVLDMIVTTAGVYVFTYTVTFLLSKKEADELNSALKRKRNSHQ